MKTAAIIAEYNPFHNGHQYHIEQTREKFGATHVFAVMSGNFTQRGDVAIVDKHKRAEAALKSGADLVIELPVAHALGSAEQFAKGAASLINALGCADILSFGSESGDIELLEETAGAVHYALTTEEFLGGMRRGLTYPAALQRAVEKYYTDEISEALASPNNTLAVEYIKALNESGSSIKPVTVKRKGAAHDGEKSGSDLKDGFASASQLRKILLNGGDVSGLTPIADISGFADIRRLETAILAKLRMLPLSAVKSAPNVNNGLENNVYKAIRAARSLNELFLLLKTKRYTMARLRRAVLCCFLGITKDDVKITPQYVRILGMNAKGREILSAASEAGCQLPMDTSLAALMKTSDKAKRQALLEERCGNVYSLAFGKPLRCGTDFTAKPIIIE